VLPLLMVLPLQSLMLLMVLPSPHPPPLS
jgi:hypothetical protein